MEAEVDVSYQLYWAARLGNLTTVEDLILTQHVPVNLRFAGTQNETALMATGFTDQVEVAKLLLSLGADVHAIEDGLKNVALHHAAIFNSVKVGAELIKAGINVNAKNKQGETALHRCCKKGHLEFADLLINNGADINLKNEDGWNGLHCSCYCGQKRLLKFMLKHGADIESRTDKNPAGVSPLMIAAMQGNASIVEILLDNKAAIDARDGGGLTALMWAVKHRRETVVKVLALSGANLTLKNKKNLTIYEMADKELLQMIYQWQPQKKTWSLGKKIGIGGFGYVYTAVDKQYEPSTVAIKCINSPVKDCNGNIRPLFMKTMREVHALSAINHPNVVRMYRAEIVEGRLHILMELVHAGSIDVVLNNKEPKVGFSEDSARYLLKQLFEVLCHLQDKGMIHRDIKPGNLLLTRQGKIKVTDFGLVRMCDTSSTLTMNAGTESFTAPEVQRNMFDDVNQVAYNFKADVWSAGLVAYQLITTFPPDTKERRSRADIVEVDHLENRDRLKQVHKVSDNFIDMFDACMIVNYLNRPYAHEVLKMAFFQTPNLPNAAQTVLLEAGLQSRKRLLPDFSRKIFK